MNKQHTVLIVDDTLENLRVLGEILEKDGHEVLIASNGLQALEIIQGAHPDLVLLDVMMPEMDGYEVCRRLKRDQKTADIPIVFLTALNDEVDEAKGLDLGAVDYILKPFKIDLVKKRIKNHLALRQMELELRRHNTSLEEQVKERTRQLTETNELLKALDSTKALYLQIIAQEIKTPANSIFGIGQLALMSIEDKAKSQRLQAIFDANKNQLNEILDNSLKIVELQDASRKAILHPVRFEEVIASASARLYSTAQERGVRLTGTIQNSWIVAADHELFLQALTVVFRVAVLFARPQTDVTYSISENGSCTVLRISALSAGILGIRTENLRDLVLIPSLSDLFQALGLNLPLAGAIIKSLGGWILVSADDDTTVTIKLNMMNYLPA